jgi:hypothetical protein
MAKGTAKEAPTMKRKKRLSIRLVALGLAAAALAAPAAQAMPDGLTGDEARALQDSRNQIVSPDDRAIDLRAEHAAPVRGAFVVMVSPDDRSMNRASNVQATPPVASDGDGYEVGTVALSGIVLLLAAGGMTAFAIYQSRNGKLANA